MLPATPPTLYEDFFRGTPLTTVYVVDEDAKALYMNTRPWSRYEILVLPTGIDNVEMEEDSRSIAGYYDLNGQQVSGKQRDPIIIRYSDGTSRRVIMK